MSSFYKKYDVGFNTDSMLSLIGEETFRMYQFGEYNVKDHDTLNKLIRSRIKFNIEPDKTNITQISSPGVPCHIDAWSVALNFYLSGMSDTNVTSFWETTVGTHSREPMTTPFNLDDLNLVETVTIKLGECYLLNTHAIHSVNVKGDSRYILRFIWYNESFNIIKDSIELI